MNAGNIDHNSSKQILITYTWIFSTHHIRQVFNLVPCHISLGMVEEDQQLEKGQKKYDLEYLDFMIQRLKLN